MIISQSELDLILNRKIRRRTIHLPIQHGTLGELKKCPAKPGGIYTLKARTPWERYRTQAETQPSRARAVLWLIERCEQPQRTVTITARTIEARENTWIVHFVVGTHELEHKPRLLAARPGPAHGEHGDYTSIPSRAASGPAEEIPETYQAKYSDSASEARKTGLSEQRERLLAAVGTLRIEAAKLNAGNSVARRRLKSVEHQLRAFEREMRRCA